MRAVIQRVSRAAVRVGDEQIGAIGPGLVALVGVAVGDTEEDADRLAARIRTLRIFEDGAGRMNRSVEDTGGGVLVLSQFTLMGDTRRGRRPSFVEAAPPDQAEPLYRRVAEGVRSAGIEVAEGRFGARMALDLVNEGPVTILLDTARSSAG